MFDNTFVMKGVICLIALVFMLAALVFLLFQFVKRVKNKRLAASIGTGVEIMAALGIVILLVPYSWPFPISVKLIECAELTSFEKIDVREEESWYCVYHIPLIGEASEDSYWGVPYIKIKGSFPEFDYNKYTYLFSFERKVEKLSYYVWDNKGPGIVDLGTANKWGTAVLSDEKYENKIFVYRFPRVAIDNIYGTKYENT